MYRVCFCMVALRCRRVKFEYKSKNEIECRENIRKCVLLGVFQGVVECVQGVLVKGSCKINNHLKNRSKAIIYN